MSRRHEDCTWHEHEEKDCDCEFSSKDRNDSFLSKLNRHRGCCVTIFFECGDFCKCIRGKICTVGCDFVDLVIRRDCCCEKIVTIKACKIVKIIWPENCCDPCKREKRCKCTDECDDD